MPSDVILRRARKAWRCTCANSIRHFVVKRTCEHGETTSTFRTEEAAETHADALRASPCHGGRFPKLGGVTITEVRNPDYRTDCLREIPVGAMYYEYMGEALPYGSGTRYCVRCAEATFREDGS